MFANEQLTGPANILVRSDPESEGWSVPVSRLSLRAPAMAMLGQAFDHVTLAEAVRRIEGMISSRQPHYVITANVDHLVQARRDVELRRILRCAHLMLCDGMPLVWLSRLLGNPLPERVAGSDLVPELIRVAAQKGHRLFLLGATPESNAQAIANLRRRHPRLNIAGHYAPPFRPLLEMDHDEIALRIRAAEPDVALVSFGCPKQEKWIAMHYRALGVPVMIGVGATIDFLAGQVRRAPLWMQRCGMEWLFRLAQEPRRLFRRYASDLWPFATGVAAQWWHMQAGSRALRGRSRCSVLAVKPGWQCLRAGARLDVKSIHRDASVWREAASGARDCMLKLDDVRFVDSTGIGLLITLQKILRADGFQLVLVSPSAAVRRAVELMRLQDWFATVGDASEALRLLRERNGASLLNVVHGDTQPCVWRGEITAANAEEIWRRTEPRLSATARTRRELAIDLAGVRFMDSAGAGLMVRARKQAERAGVKLCFTGAQPAVRNVLHLARLDDLLEKEAA